MAGKVKFNKGIANFICDKVAEGYTISRLIKEYREQLVAEKTVYIWKDRHPDFREQLALAYQTHLYKQMDELRDLSEELLSLDNEIEKKLSAAGNDPDLLKEALTQAKIHSSLMRDRRDNIRVRIDAIKFSLAHLAPKLVPELKDQPKTLIGVQMPSIQIISYKDSETKLIEGK